MAALVITGAVVGYLLAGGVCAGVLLRKRRSDWRNAPEPVPLAVFAVAVWPLLVLLYVVVVIVCLGLRVMGIRKSDLTSGGDA